MLNVFVVSWSSMLKYEILVCEYVTFYAREFLILFFFFSFFDSQAENNGTILYTFGINVMIEDPLAHST